MAKQRGGFLGRRTRKPSRARRVGSALVGRTGVGRAVRGAGLLAAAGGAYAGRKQLAAGVGMAGQMAGVAGKKMTRLGKKVGIKAERARRGAVRGYQSMRGNYASMPATRPNYSRPRG